MTDTREIMKLCADALGLVDEENRRLASGVVADSYPEIVESKSRLSLQLAAAIKSAKAAGFQVDAAEGDDLRASLATLAASIDENRRLLKARLGVTEDLISAVLATARAQSASTTRGYVRDGRIIETHRPAAVAIDRAV